ncbi:MAG: glycosyltransferase family 4 protein [Polyangiaceae bacterium]
MREALFLSYDGLTDPLGGSQILPYVVGLAGRGHRFTLVSFEKPGRFQDRGAAIRSACEVAGIDWHPLSYTKRPPMLSTVYDLARMHRTAMELHRRKRFDVVHARSVLAAMIARRIKRSEGVPFVFDIRGFWAQERVDGGLWNLAKPHYRAAFHAVRYEEDASFTEADHVVSLTHRAKEEIESWSHLRSPRPTTTVIPCCVDLRLFDPDAIADSDVADTRRTLGLAPDDFVVLYLGSIGTWYMLGEMLDFFARVRRVRPSAKFLFVTQDEPALVFREAERRGIPATALVVRPSPRERVPTHVAVADCSLFFIKPLPSKMASSPTKQGEVMAMGVPVVCNRGIGDTDTIVEKYDAGVLVDRFDDRAYDDAIARLLARPDRRSATARTGAREWFSLDVGIDRYAGVYASLPSADRRSTRD